MRTFKCLLCLALLLVFALNASAQKPAWIGNTPKELNYTYKFVEVTSEGSTLESARAEAKDLLADNTQLQEGVRVYRKTHERTNIDKQRVNGGKLSESVHKIIAIDLTIDGERFDLQAVRVDEYSERRNGIYVLHTLYMVALCEDPVFDRTYLTTKYGAAPVFMSVIPGLGQWYKGSKGKGIALFASEAVAVGGILVCENQRASYVKKMKEQPKFLKEYNQKADNWETGRNICIGVAAGVWIYNIVDAAVAKGARRVVVSRADGRGVAMAPFAIPEGGAGVSLSYRF